MSGAGCRNSCNCQQAFEFGKTYPEPIIEHRLGRERALKAYAKIRAR
jgi:deoxyribodipyrimidine photolyase